VGALFTIHSDGRGEKQLTHTARNVTDDQPDWSPDASLIAFTRCAPNAPCAIYTVKPDGSQLKRLSPKPCLPGPPECEDGANASFLPDGRHFVCVYVRANSPLSKPSLERALFVANANGRGSRRITPWSLNGGDNPDWAPNGKLIVFRSHEEDEDGAQSQIYVVRPDGHGLQQLTHFKPGTEVLSYSFSPDGKWITFAKTGTAGLPDLFVMRPNGKNIQPVTHSKLWDSAPDWGTTH
jgi:TolB protein